MERQLRISSVFHSNSSESERKVVVLARIVSCSMKRLKVLLSGCIHRLSVAILIQGDGGITLSNILVEKILENQQP